MWLIGAIIICSIIKLLFCVLFLATSRQEDVPNTEPRKTMLNVVLWLFIFEYSLMGLLTLTVLDQRKSASTEQNRGTKEANAILVWDTIVCLIITVAASTLLALCYSSIVGVTTCLSVCRI